MKTGFYRKTHFIGSKIKYLRNNYPDLDIQVDGGINLKTYQLCLEKGANIFAFDPILKSKPNSIKLLQNCTVCATIEDALKDSDAAMIFTKWPEFKSLDSKFLKQFMKNPIIIDGRGFLAKEKFDNGTYFKIGYSE